MRLLWLVVLQATVGLTPTTLKVRNDQSVKYLHRDPDVMYLPKFISSRDCVELIEAAGGKFERSPVAYSGWTTDVEEIVRLWVRGPGLWLGAAAEWWTRSIPLTLGALGLSTLAVFGLASGWADWRRQNLQSLRTSKSTTLRGDTDAEFTLMRRFSQLLDIPPDRFEAVTCIKYDPDDFLMPHFDANDAATIEDKNRGGQTLATLLVYLNPDDVMEGQTRFNDLGPLDVRPTHPGDACLFFPADGDGRRDDRLRHEGRPPRGHHPKYIARIWVHQSSVPPPCGLDPTTLAKFYSPS